MSQDNEVFARSQSSYCSPTNANSYNTVTSSPCSSSSSYPVYTSFTVTTANLLQEHYGYSHHSVISASPSVPTTPSAANPTAISPYIQGNHQHSTTSLTHHPTHLTRSNSYTYYAPVPLEHLPSPNSYPLPTPPLTAPIHPLRSYFFPTVVGHQQFKGIDDGVSKPQSATMLTPVDGSSGYNNHETLATALLQLQDPVIRTSVPSAAPIVSLPSSMSSPPVSTFNNVPYSVQSPWRPNWPYLPIMQQEYRGNPCHICGKTYARLSTLRSHLKSHTGEKPYQCSICQKSFTQAANLTAHLRTHSGEKPFKCPVCHRGFSQSSSVTTHMRTHSGDRPYKCNVCSKGFADSSTLTKHYRTHTGEKPYQCKICEARFSQSGNLNRHMRTHQQHFGMQHIQEPMSMSVAGVSGVGGRSMGEYSETDSMGSASTSDITKMEMVVLNEGGRVSM